MIFPDTVPFLRPVLQFHFDSHVLDTDTRELRRGSESIAVEPQVLDLLVYLVENRDRVVSKDDLIASVWGGRIVSDAALTSRIYAARKAIGDTGRDQKLIRTISRKGLRFIGTLDARADEQRASFPPLRWRRSTDRTRAAPRRRRIAP